jgi:hypothetical protein
MYPAYCIRRVGFFILNIARGRGPGDRSSTDERKVRTSRAECWVTPRRSNPTPAPQRIDRRWPKRWDPNGIAADQARVKRRGKSPPRGWRHHRHGKRHLMQDQIGRQLPHSLERGDRLARPRSSGRSLEVRGNSDPREMITAVEEHILNGTESGL